MERGRRHWREKNTAVDDNEASRRRDKLREEKEKITRDAFVPRKKDRRGNIFGFIRFEAVKNVDYLINEVKNVRVGSAKIGVNASKFSGNNHSVPSVPAAKPSHRPRPQPENNYMSPPHHKNVGNSFEENSYRAALTGKASSNEQTMKVDISTLVNDIKNYLQKPIYPDIGVQYIGGLKVLLTFKTDEEMQAFMIEEEKIHGKFFSVPEQWENHVYNYDRVVWLTIRGRNQSSFDVWVIEDEETWIPKCLYDNTAGSESMVSVSRGMSPKIGHRRSLDGLPGGVTVENEEVVSGTKQSQNETGSEKATSELNVGGFFPKIQWFIFLEGKRKATLMLEPRPVNIDLEAPLIAQPFSFPIPNSLDLNSDLSPPACHNAIEDEVNCQMQVLDDTCPIQVIQPSTIRQPEIDGVQIRDNSESSNGLSKEIGDTIKVGGTMGVNLEGFEKPVD
ncbi:hypothetical protein L1987_82239 [Smallanthus sonchifolius]|uniref:Uncharacterized protein n=1 Tax=Smallanthus sonchifolius TaxID=185202 RepID=A0ACB8YAT3_9ASTR|nr:hypothetical protein L1987_82239 [Smallanthus sonchifolius]